MLTNEILRNKNSNQNIPQINLVDAVEDPRERMVRRWCREEAGSRGRERAGGRWEGGRLLRRVDMRGEWRRRRSWLV